jgi:hypothetical protein
MIKKATNRKRIRTYVDHFLDCAFIRFVDLPYHIANHLIGPDHTPIHRKTIGVLVMVMGGAIVSLLNSASSYIVIHIIGDAVGNGIHAVGFLPFIKEIENNTKTSIS